MAAVAQSGGHVPPAGLHVTQRRGRHGGPQGTRPRRGCARPPRAAVAAPSAQAPAVAQAVADRAVPALDRTSRRDATRLQPEIGHRGIERTDQCAMSSAGGSCQAQSRPRGLMPQHAEIEADVCPTTTRPEEHLLERSATSAKAGAAATSWASRSPWMRVADSGIGTPGIDQLVEFAAARAVRARALPRRRSARPWSAHVQAGGLEIEHGHRQRRSEGCGRLARAGLLPGADRSTLVDDTVRMQPTPPRAPNSLSSGKRQHPHHRVAEQPGHQVEADHVEEPGHVQRNQRRNQEPRRDRLEQLAAADR